MAVNVQMVMVLLLVATCGASKSSCPEGLPLSERCICSTKRYDRADMYVVNCTSTDWSEDRAHEVLAELPPETEVLIFTGNTVPELHGNVFGDGDLSQLTVVDLSDNRIRDISGKSFHHAPNVQRLILDHNELDADGLRPRLLSGFSTLRELHLTDAFADRSGQVPNALHDMFLRSELVRLEKLHLEQNELRSLGPDGHALCGLPALMDLHLGDNELTAIPILDPHCSPMLRYLDLRRNRITRITAEDVSRLAKLSRARRLTLDLAANPFECATASLLLELPRVANITLRDANSIRCRHRFANGTEVLLRLEEAAAETEGGVAVAVVSVAALAAVGAALLAWGARRRRRRRYARGIVSGTVSYTSIEPEDV